jgi:hypothetical protein
MSISIIAKRQLPRLRLSSTRISDEAATKIRVQHQQNARRFGFAVIQNRNPIGTRPDLRKGPQDDPAILAWIQPDGKIRFGAALSNTWRQNRKKYGCSRIAEGQSPSWP